MIRALERAEVELGRKVNPTVTDRHELAANAHTGKGLVSRLLQKPRIMIIGTDNELEKLAGKPLDRCA